MLLEHVSIGALGDSFYEYLLKSWIWSGRKDDQLKGMYDQALDAIEKQLLFQSRQNQLWYFAEMKVGFLAYFMIHVYFLGNED